MKTRWCLGVVGLALFAACYGVWGEAAGEGPVQVAVLNEGNFDRLVPEGKEVDAIYGDIVLRNEHVTAVIAAPVPTRNANMTVRDVAGCLIDLTTRTSGSDQLSAFYPGMRQYPYRSWSVQVDENESLDVVDSLDANGRSVSVVVKADADENRPAVEVTYRLAAEASTLDVITRYSNPGDTSLSFELTDDLRADAQKEDMPKSANGTHDLFWIEDRFWQQAYGIVADQRRLQTNTDSRRTQIKYVDGSDSAAVTIPAGESLVLSRSIAPGSNLLAVRSVFGADQGTEYTPVTLAVRDKQGRWVPEARLEVRQNDESLGSVTTNGRGETTIPLTAGSYVVRVLVQGNQALQGRELVVHSNVQQEESIILQNYDPGKVVGKITDEQGGPIACKVEFTPKGDMPRPNWGPETAEFATGNLRYVPRGEFEQALYPGMYDVIISHGPEYDAIFTELEIKPGETSRLEHQLVRSVDTTGWVSSDFHSHSTPSGDNTSSQLGRVLNLVCEHIEFAPCTEHNRIDTYVPHIKRLGIEKEMATCSGIELTGSPLPLNHQNAFPLHHHHHHQDGGGPITDGDPSTQIERLALWDNRSEKLIQQNHPDIGWLFYDKDGDGQPDDGYARGIGYIDVMEIHPIALALELSQYEQRDDYEGNHRIFNWLQLLNQGYRIPGVTNTDAHYNYHGSGWLRIWIESPTDDPAEIDTLDMVHAAEHGQVLMSNGPFLTVWATALPASTDAAPSGASIGEELRAPNGDVQLHVRVQCPNWLDVDHVFLLVNGRKHADHDYTRDAQPDAFDDGVVKFDRTLDLKLESDAHLVVVAGHHGRTLEPVYGGQYGKQHPAALANPIFVDVDGDGFTPNKDTLGSPLPVKHPL